MICKIVRVEKLMCLIFMKSIKRKEKKKKKKVKKVSVLHYSIDIHTHVSSHFQDLRKKSLYFWMLREESHYNPEGRNYEINKNKMPRKPGRINDAKEGKKTGLHQRDIRKKNKRHSPTR